MSSTTAAAVVAIEDEQLLTLAQTGIARQLSVGGRRVLGQDVASSGRDDPAPTRTRQYEQGAGSPGVEFSAAHVRLSAKQDNDACAGTQSRLGAQLKGRA
jgi:hypothetical protein